MAHNFSCFRCGISRFCFAALLCLLSGNFSAAEDSAVPQQLSPDAQEIIYSVMSPYCPGKLLGDCPSAQAGELREKIRTELHDGKSKQAVYDGLFALYGEELRAAPEGRGFGITAWTMPAIFLVLGALALGLWYRRQARKQTETEAAVLSAEDQQALDQIIKRSL